MPSSTETERFEWSPWAAVAGLILAATLGAMVLDRDVSLTSQAMLYLLAVVVAAYNLRPLPSIACAVAAVTAFNFFFVPPRLTFAVDSREHVIALAVTLVVALVISRLTAKLRTETRSAQLHASRAHQLQTLAGTLAATTSAEAAVAVARRALDVAFPGRATMVTLGSEGADEREAGTPDNTHDVLRACMREAATLGPGTGRWPGLNAWYIPLGDASQMQGAVCIEGVQAADVDGLEHAQALCALVAQALHRLKMATHMLAAEAEAQRQQMQGTFLAAISHDLRSPLASIMGAASALQSQSEKLEPAEKERLLASISGEARYLSDVTENTLQFLQLTNASAPQQRTWESMEEIAGAVLARMRQRDPDHRIRASVAKDLPLIQADAVLIAQLLVNLLENALKYSQGAIDLVIRATPTQLRASVKDRGPSIPGAQYDQIFQPYARNDRSGQRGAGLGLALCRAIAQSHHGSLTVKARQAGGNSFTFAMPLSPEQPRIDMESAAP